MEYFDGLVCTVKQYVRALGRAADQLAACSDRGAVVRAAADLLVSDFPAYLAMAWLPYDEGRGFRLSAHRGANAAEESGEPMLSDSDPLTLWVEEASRTQAPVYRVLQTGDQSQWWRRDDATAVVLPLLIEEETVGVLAAFFDEVLSDEATGALLALTKVVAMALDRASLAERQGRAPWISVWADDAEGGASESSDVVGHQLGVARSSSGDVLQREYARLRALQREARARIQAAEERLESRARLAAEHDAVLHQMAEGVVLADADGSIAFINDAGRRILGVGRAGMALRDYAEAFDVLMPDGRNIPWEERSLVRAIRRGESSINQVRLVRRADGTEVITESSAVPVFDADGRLLGAVLTLRDVTEQRNLDRQKDDFLTAVAHDLKAPLTTIKGFTQLLQLRASRSDMLSAVEVLDGLERIEMITSRMTVYVNELLDATRIEMGRGLDLFRRPVDLVALARQVAAERQESTIQHHLEVRTTQPALVGAWDGHRLERVLTNLLANAIKYSPAGGSISVDLEQEDGPGGPWAVLTVSDSGLGIPDADLPYIFDRFHRGKNVPKRIPGTGVGLTVVRQVVEQQGGTVSVTSVEGRGSSFTVRLPMESAQEAGEWASLGESG